MTKNLNELMKSLRQTREGLGELRKAQGKPKEVEFNSENWKRKLITKNVETLLTNFAKMNIKLTHDQKEKLLKQAPWLAEKIRNA